MAFKDVQSLEADNTVSLGGFNKKSRTENPTTAEGYYLGSKKVESKMAKSGYAYIHILQTSKGNLGVLQVIPGAMVRITQSGTRAIPGVNDMYIFKVQQDLDNCIDVDFVPEQSLVTHTSESDDGNDDDAFNNLSTSTPAQAPRVTPPVSNVATNAARTAKVQDLLNKNKRT
jgi:hypothetical protein